MCFYPSEFIVLRCQITKRADGAGPELRGKGRGDCADFHNWFHCRDSYSFRAMTVINLSCICGNKSRAGPNPADSACLNSYSDLICCAQLTCAPKKATASFWLPASGISEVTDPRVSAFWRTARPFHASIDSPGT